VPGVAIGWVLRRPSPCRGGPKLVPARDHPVRD